MVNQLPLAIGMDFGQITTGLSAIMGIGQGVTDQKTLNIAVDRMARSASKEFGALADTQGAEGSIAHVYEYGLEGYVAGRLWRMNWNNSGNTTTGVISFQTAKTPTSDKAGIDPRLAASAAAAGRTLARHTFPEKAEHLESTQTLISEAGVNRHTKRVGGDTERPSVLVYIGRNGDVKFAKRRRRENEFFGKFQELFNSYWLGTVETQAGTKVSQGFSKTVTQSAALANKSLYSSVAASYPRIPPGMGGFFATDMGRPFTGLKLREAEVAKVRSQVQKILEKELISQWAK